MTRMDEILAKFAEGDEEVTMSEGRMLDAALANDFKESIDQFNDGLIAAVELVQKLVWIATQPSAG